MPVTDAFAIVLALIAERTTGVSFDELVRQRERRFEDLTPLFPDERLKLETPGATNYGTFWSSCVG